MTRDAPNAPKPFVQDIAEAADPALAPPVPDHAEHTVEVLPPVKGGSALTRGAVWLFSVLFTFALGVAAYDFVAGLLARNLVLGWVAFGLVGLAVLAALVLALREWAAILRLGRLDGLRDRVAAARVGQDLPAARRATVALVGLYAARRDTAWGRARLAEREGEVLDADALLDLTERELLTPLDAEARLAVEAAARQVATVTALVPVALADVAIVLFANLRMIRRIAEVYGGRSGSLGSLRLLRRVFASLVAAGALALTDDLIGSVAGGGVLSKLSRRFGEGVVNGALTARIGLAAMELCRPMPFAALERPGVTALVSRALAGIVARG